MADDTLRDTFATRLDPYLAIGTTTKDIAPILDALIAAARAERTWNCPVCNAGLECPRCQTIVSALVSGG